jgi:hypothetical protein
MRMINHRSKNQGGQFQVNFRLIFTLLKLACIGGPFREAQAAIKSAAVSDRALMLPEAQGRRSCRGTGIRLAWPTSIPRLESDICSRRSVKAASGRLAVVEASSAQTGRQTWWPSAHRLGKPRECGLGLRCSNASTSAVVGKSHHRAATLGANTCLSSTATRHCTNRALGPEARWWQK